jgi:GNAT superfamily N-acetyltransferase
MTIITSPEPLLDHLVIRPARPGEEDIVLDLLAEAAAWLRGRGITQWPTRFPMVGEEPIATLAVADEDTELWGTADTAPAYYLSRLAVTRRASGVRLGHRIIDWVAHKAAAHGRQYVRLATARDNPALRRYYQRAGFDHVADPPHARWPTSLYQRPA